MDEAARAKRLIALDHGHIVKDGSPREIFSDIAGMRALGLDAPSPTKLCALLSESGVKIPTDITDVSECADALERLLKEAGK
jgi:energy-coupling factor transport system ATP-binding protein